GALPEAARRRGVDRRGELGIASRLADAPERDVWRERSLLRRKAGVGQTAFHARGETGKRLAPAAHARPHHARPRQRRKRAQALDDELERRGAASGVAQRRTGGVEPIWLDAAEELERDVQVLRRDPPDVPRDGAQPLGLGAEGCACRFVEQDRDEGADGGYRVSSRTRRNRSRLAHRVVSVSTASAARR